MLTQKIIRQSNQVQSGIFRSSPQCVNLVGIDRFYIHIQFSEVHPCLSSPNEHNLLCSSWWDLGLLFLVWLLFHRKMPARKSMNSIPQANLLVQAWTWYQQTWNNIMHEWKHPYFQCVSDILCENSKCIALPILVQAFYTIYMSFVMCDMHVVAYPQDPLRPFDDCIPKSSMVLLLDYHLCLPFQKIPW